MILWNIYYVRVIWMEFWNYINNVNICNFFLFKVLYYIVYVVCYLNKKMKIINWIKLYLLLLILRLKKELFVDIIFMVSVFWGLVFVIVNMYIVVLEVVDFGIVIVMEVLNENWGVLFVLKINNFILCNRI